MAEGKVVGIDLGTTNSVVAVLEGGEPTIITSKEGDKTVPSVVQYADGGAVVVGKVAKQAAAAEQETTVYSVKRLMGHSDAEVAEDKKHLAYQVGPGTGSRSGRAEVMINGQQIDPEAVSAEVLKKLKADAEAYLREPVTRAVITVPAYFNQAQREATKQAGKLAGLDVLRIINEPTAAALAYGISTDQDKTILVFDLGGGTFDVSVLSIGVDEVAGGTERTFMVKSTSGDTYLGGDDYDRAVMSWLSERFQANTGVDLLADDMARGRLKEAAEEAKKALSSSMEYQVNLPYITVTNKGPQHLKDKLTRTEFERITADLTNRCKTPVEDALREAGLTAADVDEVLLVGGSTRMPAVRALVEGFFGKEKVNAGVNPDEVVAAGAAVQGAVLNKEVTGAVLVDVTPLSLGIRVKGGKMEVLISRNTIIPTRMPADGAPPLVFTTAEDGQEDVLVEVYQGERPLAEDNRKLGEFSLAVPYAKAGVPQIAVTFDVDKNGIVTVSAKDLATNTVASVTCSNSGSLSDGDVEKMIADAAQNAGADQVRADAVTARNLGPGLADKADKVAQEQGGSLPDQGMALMDASREMRQALRGGTDQQQSDAYHKLDDTLKGLYEQMMKAQQEAAERRASMQQAATEAAEAHADQNGAQQGGPVVDADPSWDGMGA